MRARPIALSGGIAATALLGSAGTAQAANLVVNTNDGTLDDNNCELFPDPCTLREAVNEASGDSVADTITFAATVTGTINLDGTLNVFGGPLTITGPGADELTVNAGDVSGRRIFYLANALPAGSDVTISGLTLTGGNGGTSAVGGGAILKLNGDLTLTDAVITGNNALNAAGIRNQAGTLTIEDSELSDNDAFYFDNTSSGGAIFSTSSGALTIRNSTLSGNSAAADSGYGASGGGIALYGSSGPVTIDSSTIADNSVDSAFDSGGGIANPSLTPPVLRNTIVADNTVVGGGQGPDLIGTFNAAFSLIEDTSFATINETVTGSNITGEDPLLGALALNGAATRTQAPGPTSPARDAGRSFCLDTDQRGSPRPSDLAAANSTATGADGSDIGAFEEQGGTLGTPALCLPVTPPPPPKCRGKPATLPAGATRGTNGPDVIVGTGARNVIRGRGGKDTICGLAGRDRLIGGGGRDTLVGGAGRDTLIGGGGRDILRGGAGRDIQRQ